MTADGLSLALVTQEVEKERDRVNAAIDKATCKEQRWYYIGQAVAYIAVVDMLTKYNAGSRALPSLRDG